MPEVQGIGATDYQMPAVQPQNQYMDEPAAEEDMPMVYNPEDDVKRKAASSKLGLMCLAAIAIGGLGFWAGHTKGKKAGNEEVKNLKEFIQNKHDAAKEADEKSKWFNGKRKEFVKSFIEDAKPYVEDAEKAAEDVAKDADKKPVKKSVHS